MSELKNMIKKVKKDYDTFPKTTYDEGEFIIIAEVDHGGSYDEYKECLGVNRLGELLWSYLSGCSCSGDNEHKKVTDISAKTFNIEASDTVEEFYSKHKIEPYQTSYTSY